VAAERAEEQCRLPGHICRVHRRPVRQGSGHRRRVVVVDRPEQRHDLQRGPPDEPDGLSGMPRVWLRQRGRPRPGTPPSASSSWPAAPCAPRS
jgi:hypothetical protein